MRPWLALGLLLAPGSAAAQTTDTIEAFRAACERGEAWYCRELGLRYVVGRVADPDPGAKAELYLKVACDASDALACYNLGVLYDLGELLPADPVWASFYYERGCADGDRPSCTAAAWLALTGRGKVPRDVPHSRALLEKACATELPDAWGCHLLGVQQLDGIGGPPDAKAALVTLNLGCRAGWPHSCKLAVKARKKAERAGRR